MKYKIHRNLTVPICAKWSDTYRSDRLPPVAVASLLTEVGQYRIYQMEQDSEPQWHSQERKPHRWSWRRDIQHPSVWTLSSRFNMQHSYQTTWLTHLMAPTWCSFLFWLIRDGVLLWMCPPCILGFQQFGFHAASCGWLVCWHRDGIRCFLLSPPPLSWHQLPLSADLSVAASTRAVLGVPVYSLAGIGRHKAGESLLLSRGRW